MVASCVWPLPLLLLAQLLPVDGVLEEVDKKCEGTIECVHHTECEPYKEAKKQLKTLPKPSCKLKEARQELIGKTCNKAEQGVCCSPCALGQVCTPQEDCQSFTEEKSKLINLDKGSSEYTSARENLAKKICDRATRTVCCEKNSRCISTDPVNQSGWIPGSKSCDPANGSCLPEWKCGIAGGEQRIVGGQDALPGEFPFTALLGRKTKRKVRKNIEVDKYIYTCGGTLINLRYVVTAAHCHHPTEAGKQINLVRLGEYEVTDRKGQDCTGTDFCLDDPQEFDIKPEDVTRHPDFEEESDGRVINDIALIRLPKLAKENRAVRLACLPIDAMVAARELNVPDIREGLVSYRPTAVGWGKNVTSEQLSGVREKVGSAIQQKLALPVLSKSECSRRYLEPRTDQICAGGEAGKEFCTGDSGGPLFMKSVIDGTKESAGFDHSKPWYLLGIVSFGTCGRGNPGIFTRLESFIPWIQKTISD